MAFDPYSGQVFGPDRGELAPGHYSNRADEYDGPLRSERLQATGGIEELVDDDPVSVAQQAAADAAMELNMASVRTPEMVARVEALARQAHYLASEANLQIMLEQVHETS